ncbi:MAG TPA: type III pantothenate kinase [Candidatus Omnitrophota bacterium]|nr:type III pantothenate kinase [Candidatus Omnitrophota bacterium]
MKNLVIDIGNTNTSFGIFKANRLIRSWDIPTGKIVSGRDLKLNKAAINSIVICSVVPKATRALKAKVIKQLHIMPLVVGEDIKVPVKNLYRNPKQVGQDRLVNAFAGLKIFGAPLIIVDFGTAITFDVVSARAEYVGGMIIPGLKISLEALATKCALLPEAKLAAPRELIGKDTKNSILSGMLNGFGCLCDGVVIKLKKQFKKQPIVVATGGNIGLISKFCSSIDKIDKNLTLKGLNFLTKDRF